MKISAILRKIKKKIIKEVKEPKVGKKFNILLLTNRDSDNVGDQVIEASDIALIEAVMKNLNIQSENYKINSRAASIVSQKYLSTKDAKFLKKAEDLIKKSDIVIFGGAPMFNYLYQILYERTSVTLEIAQKYNKPVIFSAIGIEGYDENNKKCQRIKKALNFDCVKQITTRDDFDSLQKYRNNEQMVIDKVSDPAVFCNKVFEKYREIEKEKKNKKIGIFILRANGFKDNKFDFSAQDAAELWVDLIQKLEEKGYDYELITSGHFSDEVFLDTLIRKYNVKESKCVFNMNSPEKLIQKISSYDGVISCRLHPSIISFSLGVPSLGLVWNPKVKGFYDSIGYENRVVDVEGINATTIIEKMEQAIEQGIDKDEEYLISVYNYLFYGIKRELSLSADNISPYTYDELINNIPGYKGTSEKEQEEKLKRKFRRVYSQYNKIFEENIKHKNMLNNQKK